MAGLCPSHTTLAISDEVKSAFFDVRYPRFEVRSSLLRLPLLRYHLVISGFHFFRAFAFPQKYKKSAFFDVRGQMFEVRSSLLRLPLLRYHIVISGFRFFRAFAFSQKYKKSAFFDVRSQMSEVRADCEGHSFSLRSLLDVRRSSVWSISSKPIGGRTPSCGSTIVKVDPFSSSLATSITPP